jgi:SAM-dependent methyltransferase
MSLLRRALTSLRDRGVWGSVDITLAILAERFFDWRYGTDTLTHIKLSSLAIPSENRSSGIEYQPTRVRPFRRLMKTVRFPPGSALVDFGCGKGRVLMEAARCGFRRVVGVEFSPDLCRIAERNIAAFRQRSGTNAEIRIVECDAVEYTIQDDDNVFYMFHPFKEAVMEKVLGNIARSLEKEDREMLLLYHYPACREVIENQRVFALESEYVFSGSHFSVYRHGPRKVERGQQAPVS